MIKNREIQFISYIIMFWFILYGQANSLDCRRHVFAPGCRGIVAKRTQNLNNIKFETQTGKSIASDGSQSSSSSSITSSLLSPPSDEDLIVDQDRPESVSLKRFTLPLIFMLNRANRPTTINSDFNNNNPTAWLFSLTPSIGSSNYNNNNNVNAIPLTSIMASDHQSERQSNDNYD